MVKLLLGGTKWEYAATKKIHFVPYYVALKFLYNLTWAECIFPVHSQSFLMLYLRSVTFTHVVPHEFDQLGREDHSSA